MTIAKPTDQKDIVGRLQDLVSTTPDVCLSCILAKEAITEITALRTDAGRYRWLRDPDNEAMLDKMIAAAQKAMLDNR